MTNGQIRLARQDPAIREELLLERARISFWHFCQLMFPNFYRDERVFLREMCDKLQHFVETDEKQYFVLNCPPRHGKSLTAQCLAAWLFGQSPQYKILTGSYNETLSAVFSLKLTPEFKNNERPA